MDAGHGLLKVGSSLVPFENDFPKDTQLYKLMTSKPGEGYFAGQTDPVGSQSEGLWMILTNRRYSRTGASFFDAPVC